MKRKIILNLAMSLDGYIVDENGKYDWIHGHGDNSLNTPKLFDFPAFVDTLDIVVMGRKSYEDIGVGDYKNKKVVVATTKPMKNYDNVEFVSEGIVEYICKLREQDGKDIWLFGGSSLADNFLKADVIDEFIIGIIPVILGNGTPMFYKGNPMTELHLEKYYVHEGVAVLHYNRQGR